VEKNAITLDRVTKRFPVYEEHLNFENRSLPRVRDGFFYALDNVSLEIKSGIFAIVAGANGSGKSLLMSIIAGLEDPGYGTVSVNGRTGLVFQEPDAQILGETPREDTAFGPVNMGLSKTEIKARVDTALKETGLADKADFPARSLSGGEKRRLAAAGVLAMNADIIIFDEPYANMDFPGVVQVNRLFQKLKADKKTVIILTHELEKCLSLADQFIVLFGGKKVYDGTAEGALLLNIEEWGIHHPLRKNESALGDLLW